MSSPMILKNSDSIQRRKLLFHRCRTSSIDNCVTTTPRRNTNVKFGEICGVTTADVVAVCCCIPCGLANLVVLAVYKVPAGLYRRAIRHKRMRKLQKKGLLQTDRPDADFIGDDGYFQLEDVEETEEEQKAVLELENEMWQKCAGFWRSPSLYEGETPKLQVQLIRK